MRKIFLILTILFIKIVSISNAATISFGPNIHYEPTAGSFEFGIDKWTYSQETISFGISSILEICPEFKFNIYERFIVGFSDNGSYIGIIGQKFQTCLDINSGNFNIIYSFESYWNGSDISILYSMCTTPIHRFCFEMNLPIFFLIL